MFAGDAAALAELEVAAGDAGFDAAGAAFDPALGAAPAIAPAFAPVAAPPPVAPVVAAAAAHVIVGHGAGVWAAAAGFGHAAAGEVAALQQRRKELRQARDAVNRDLRNAERKRQRLLERAAGAAVVAQLELGQPFRAQLVGMVAVVDRHGPPARGS